MFIKFGAFKQQRYKGIFEMAAHGLHEAAAAAAKPYIEKCHVLDVGCGEGAFARRLLDMGCTVDVCDLNTAQIKISGVNKIKADLNQPDFETKIPRLYDAVTALEITEHIENPWKLIRDIAAVLKPGGILVLSTPTSPLFLRACASFCEAHLSLSNAATLNTDIFPPCPIFKWSICFQG